MQKWFFLKFYGYKISLPAPKLARFLHWWILLAFLMFSNVFFYFAGHKFLCSSINLEMRPNVMRLSGKKNLLVSFYIPQPMPCSKSKKEDQQRNLIRDLNFVFPALANPTTCPRDCNEKKWPWLKIWPQIKNPQFWHNCNETLSKWLSYE